MSPLEAMARAIYERSHHCEPYEACPEWWIGIARAALTALRNCELTESMIVAFSKSEYDGGEISDIFRATLDAVLEEK